jgi:dipeptidase
MCDTMAARAGATATGGTLFAKNSDRERNEAQFLELNPARQYGRGAVLRATYIAIPQAARTHAVLLSRPFWIWGAEMGANEHGVVIGNEAVRPRSTPQRRPALIGMDLLRLGLERGATAAEAVQVITDHLEKFGQGGNCGHLSRRWYDNSFIVADANEVFVLETLGRRWATERAPATRAISNTYTIGTTITACSTDLEQFAREQGWWNGEKFDFSAAVTNFENPGLPGAIQRCARSSELLARDAGRLTPAHMMAILRDHGRATGPDFHPQDIVGRSVCAHGAGARGGGNSVSSLVSDLRADGAVHWVTGTSAPCLSIFKPVFLQDGLPDQGPIPGDKFDNDTLWWRHEALHRAALADYPEFMAEFAPARDALEASFAARIDVARGERSAVRRNLVEQCWREAAQFEKNWMARTRGRAALLPSYRAGWVHHDRLAGASLLCTPAPQALAAD